MRWWREFAAKWRRPSQQSETNRYSDYKATVFIDANVVLEGKPLAELPWASIHAEGPILVLLLPQVLKEIDSKKRDGRLGTLARTFNRLIAPAAESGQPITICEGALRVDATLALCSPIPWDDYDDLDPSDGDSRVVAQMLNTLHIPLEQRVLVSNDINPIAMASRRGLNTVRATETWLRQTEPSKADKEVTRLNLQLAELKKNQPTLEIAISLKQTQPVDLLRVAALTHDEQAELIRSILSKNRKPQQPQGMPFSVSHSYETDTTLDRRYGKYADDVVPAFASKLHTYLERNHCQVPLSIEVANVGAIQAEKLVVEIEVVGGWINNRHVLAPQHWPSPPKRKEPFEHLINTMPNIRSSYVPGRHETHFAERPEKGPRITMNCEDFRQGKTWTFDGVVWIDPHVSNNCEIRVQVTAANLHGQVSEKLRIKKVVTDTHFSTLVDPTTGQYVKPPPMAAVLDAAFKRREYDAVDIEKIKGE